jgi:hypothetical protein
MTAVTRASRWVVALAALIILAGAATEAGATARLHWDYYVFATGGDGIPVMGDVTVTDQDSVYGSYQYPGSPDAGNFASAEFFADFDYGAVGARAAAVGACNPEVWPYGYTSTGRVNSIVLEDVLTFSVAAGTYPAGVTVGVACELAGWLSATTLGYSSVDYRADFHTGYHSGSREILHEDAATIPIHDVFTLSVELVAPGDEATAPTDFDRLIRLSISDVMTDNNLGGTSPNYLTGAAAVDVYSALQVTEVIVPAGVTWTSESGSFLSAIGTGAGPVDAPTPVRLHDSYPNPFNPATVIPFSLQRETRVRLRVFDLRGREVSTLVDGVVPAGYHEAPFRAADLPAGTYVYLLEAAGRRLGGRMTLVK